LSSTINLVLCYLTIIYIYNMKNLGLDFYFLTLYDKINTDKCEILKFLHELEYPKINRQVTEYVRLLSINHIYLCEVTFFMKEYFLLKKIWII